MCNDDDKISYRLYDEDGSIRENATNAKDFEEEMMREDQVLRKLKSRLNRLKKNHEEELIRARDTRERIVLWSPASKIVKNNQVGISLLRTGLNLKLSKTLFSNLFMFAVSKRGLNSC